LSDVSVDYSFGILAYPAAICYSIFDVASTTTADYINFWTTYDMANHITFLIINSSTRTSY
jgi:hypothetical protein